MPTKKHTFLTPRERAERLERALQKFVDAFTAQHQQVLEDYKNGGTECLSDHAWVEAAVLKTIHDAAREALSTQTKETGK